MREQIGTYKKSQSQLRQWLSLFKVVGCTSTEPTQQTYFTFSNIALLFFHIQTSIDTDV